MKTLNIFAGILKNYRVKIFVVEQQTSEFWSMRNCSVEKSMQHWAKFATNFPSVCVALTDTVIGMCIKAALEWLRTFHWNKISLCSTVVYVLRCLLACSVGSDFISIYEKKLFRKPLKLSMDANLECFVQRKLTKSLVLVIGRLNTNNMVRSKLLMPSKFA